MNYSRRLSNFLQKMKLQKKKRNIVKSNIKALNEIIFEKIGNLLV